MTIDVAIVGAGAAGIAAGRRLAKRGIETTILEAKPTIGGRAVTDNATFGVPFDRGCYWLHSPTENPLKSEADRLGIRFIEDAPPPRFARAGHWLGESRNAECHAAIAAGFERIAAVGTAGRDVSADEALDRDDPWHEIVTAEFVAKQGLPPAQSSTADFARYVWIGEDLPVVGGLGNLIAQLGQSLPLSLATPVATIDRSAANGVRIETSRGTVEARAAIVTVSTGVLGSGAIRFVPELPGRHRAAIDALPMGHCEKVALSFTRRVLGDVDNAMIVPILGASEAVEIVLRPGGHEMAIVLVNGPFAQLLSRAGAAAMTSYALQRLVELFGSDVRAALAPARATTGWDSDPFVRGYVSVAQPGRADARRDLAVPIDGKLFFAGEATSLRFMGDVHGAWLSGIEAADQAARALGRSTGTVD